MGRTPKSQLLAHKKFDVELNNILDDNSSRKFNTKSTYMHTTGYSKCS